MAHFSADIVSANTLNTMAQHITLRPQGTGGRAAREARGEIPRRHCPQCAQEKLLQEFRRWELQKRALHRVCNTCSPTPPLSQLSRYDLEHPTVPHLHEKTIRNLHPRRIQQELVWRAERTREVTQKNSRKNAQIARASLAAPTLADLKKEIAHASVTSAPSSTAPTAAKTFQAFYLPILRQIRKQIKMWVRDGAYRDRPGREYDPDATSLPLRTLRVARKRSAVDVYRQEWEAKNKMSGAWTQNAHNANNANNAHNTQQEVHWQDWLSEDDIRLLKQESRKYIPAKGVRYREPGYLRAVRFEE